MYDLVFASQFLYSETFTKADTLKANTFGCEYISKSVRFRQVKRLRQSNISGQTPLSALGMCLL